MLRVRVIGGVTAEVDGRVLEPPASRRAWALLGWLALHPGLHSRADVTARLWPDVLDSSARQSLRSALWSLRSVLDDTARGALVTSRDRIGLRDDVDIDVDIDVRRFATDVKAGSPTEAAAFAACGQVSCADFASRTSTSSTRSRSCSARAVATGRVRSVRRPPMPCAAICDSEVVMTRQRRHRSGSARRDA